NQILQINRTEQAYPAITPSLSSIRSEMKLVSFERGVIRTGATTERMTKD
ncbi:hypothetical protein NPIL_158561, partial [Nephila pilipes]